MPRCSYSTDSGIWMKVDCKRKSICCLHLPAPLIEDKNACLPATLPSCYCSKVLASMFLRWAVPFHSPCHPPPLAQLCYCRIPSFTLGIQQLERSLWGCETWEIQVIYLLWYDYPRVIYIQYICKNFWHAVGIIFSLKLSLESSSIY